MIRMEFHLTRNDRSRFVAKLVERKVLRPKRGKNCHVPRRTPPRRVKFARNTAPRNLNGLELQETLCALIFSKQELLHWRAKPPALLPVSAPLKQLDLLPSPHPGYGGLFGSVDRIKRPPRRGGANAPRGALERRCRRLSKFYCHRVVVLPQNGAHLGVAEQSLSDLSQSAIWNFSSLLVVLLLIICTCAYIHQHYPSLMDRNKQGHASLSALF